MSEVEKHHETTPEGLILIHHPDEIPNFASEEEEADFWGTHAWSEEALETAAPDPKRTALLKRERTRSVGTSIRLEQDMLRRLKQLAKRKRMGYQTLMKQFVAERLYEEEKREGVIRHQRHSQP